MAKHSHAEEARVGLSLSEFQELLLEIRDNGHGFDSTKAHSGHGFLAMENYVTALGGTLEVGSAPGMGTTVKALVPVSIGQSFASNGKSDESGHAWPQTPGTPADRRRVP